MENVQIQEVKSHKHLGLYLSSDCSWHQHINYIKDKAWLSNVEYRQIECRISNIKLNPTKSIRHSQFECEIEFDIRYSTFDLNVGFSLIFDIRHSI